MTKFKRKTVFMKVILAALGLFAQDSLPSSPSGLINLSEDYARCAALYHLVFINQSELDDVDAEVLNRLEGLSREFFNGASITSGLAISMSGSEEQTVHTNFAQNVFDVEVARLTIMLGDQVPDYELSSLCEERISQLSSTSEFIRFLAEQMQQ